MPQRFPRPVMALIAAGAAVVSICLSAMPASASSVRQSEWWLGKLDVTTAWLASQGVGVTVAVLSDGVNASQPDLTGVVTAAPALPGAPQATGKFFGEQGTGIASLIAGRGHGSAKSYGVMGVAPAAKILSVPVTLPADDPQLATPSVAALIPNAIATGIRYAVSHGAQVIDLPIDPGQPSATGLPGDLAAAGGSTAERAAVQYAIAHGVVLVAPAGDDETTTDAPNYPAAYPGVIAVGAFNKAFIKAPFSSHDSYVTLTAAGQGVTADANAGGYQTMNTTAAASAVVSGVVALIRSRYPSLGVNAVRTALISSTVFRPRGGRLDGSGYGTVDAARAVAAAAELATPPSQRAGAHAQQVLAPSAIPVSAKTTALTPSLIRAGEISGGLLVVLLVLIAWYALARRRKARRQRASTTEWTRRPAQSRYPQAMADSDAALGYLAAPLAVAGSIAASGVAQDRGPFSAAGPGLGQPRTVGRELADGDARPMLGPASRAVDRRPAVTGAPPWEPAPPPVGELPWTTMPALGSGVPSAPALPAGAASLAAGAAPSSEPPLAGIPTAPPSAGRASGQPLWASRATAEPAADHPEAHPLWASRATAEPAADHRKAREPDIPGPGNLPALNPATGSNLPARSPVGANPPAPSTADADPLNSSPAGQTLSGRPVRPSARTPWDSGGQVGDKGPSDWISLTGYTAATDRPAPVERSGPSNWPRRADILRRLDQASAGDTERPATVGSPADSAADGWVSAARHASAQQSDASQQAWSDEASWDQANPLTEQNPTRMTAAGLPIRQPRSVSAAPHSTGSLWEPAASRPRDYTQAGYRRGSHEQPAGGHTGELSADSPDDGVPHG